MYLVLIIIHVLICIGLITSILLQAGRGGGLTEAIGGGTVQSVLGTQAPEVLKKATEIAAILFLLTSLGLGMITARRGRSLMQSVQNMQMPAGQTAGQASPGNTMPMPVAPQAPAAPEVPEIPAGDTGSGGAQPSGSGSEAAATE
jgi:preprotein translocase subunit SecG